MIRGLPIFSFSPFLPLSPDFHNGKFYTDLRVSSTWIRMGSRNAVPFGTLSVVAVVGKSGMIVFIRVDHTSTPSGRLPPTPFHFGRVLCFHGGAQASGELLRREPHRSLWSVCCSVLLSVFLWCHGGVPPGCMAYDCCVAICNLLLCSGSVSHSSGYC